MGNGCGVEDTFSPHTSPKHKSNFFPIIRLLSFSHLIIPILGVGGWQVRSKVEVTVLDTTRRYADDRQTLRIMGISSIYHFCGHTRFAFLYLAGLLSKLSHRNKQAPLWGTAFRRYTTYLFILPMIESARRACLGGATIVIQMYFIGKWIDLTDQYSEADILPNFRHHLSDLPAHPVPYTKFNEASVKYFTYPSLALYMDQKLYFRLLPVYEARHSICNVRSTHQCLFYSVYSCSFRLLEYFVLIPRKSIQSAGLRSFPSRHCQFWYCRHIDIHMLIEPWGSLLHTHIHRAPPSKPIARSN